MAVENGEWIMYGIDESDPSCLHNADDLTAYINRVGFLPLFKNKIAGFSVEEHTSSDYWWTGDLIRDPWEWRMMIAKSHTVAYGKFFSGKAGFISPEWLPALVNYRRDGYDFDSLWDDEKAEHRQKKIMDCFSDGEEFFSYQIKEIAGFGKDGEKNFEGVMTVLQNRLYLVMSDFQQKKNKHGQEYGWNIAKFSRPENIWGYNTVTSLYNEPPAVSYSRIIDAISGMYRNVSEKQISSVIGQYRPL